METLRMVNIALHEDFHEAHTHLELDLEELVVEELDLNILTLEVP